MAPKVFADAFAPQRLPRANHTSHTHRDAGTGFHALLDSQRPDQPALKTDSPPADKSNTASARSKGLPGVKTPVDTPNASVAAVPIIEHPTPTNEAIAGPSANQTPTHPAEQAYTEEGAVRVGPRMMTLPPTEPPGSRFGGNPAQGQDGSAPHPHASALESALPSIPQRSPGELQKADHEIEGEYERGPAFRPRPVPRVQEHPQEHKPIAAVEGRRGTASVNLPDADETAVENVRTEREGGAEKKAARPLSAFQSPGAMNGSVTKWNPSPIDPRLFTRSHGESREPPVAPLMRPEGAGGSARSSSPTDFPTKIDVTRGEGDAVAATLGRFLISADGETSGSTLPSGTSAEVISPGGIVSAGAGKSVASAQIMPANTVSQLLTAGDVTTDVIGGAAKVLAASNTSGRQQVTLQLDPPELGQLRLEVRMHQDAMTLRVSAESQAVARLIESRLPELREALATHGIRVDRSEVIVNSPPSSESSSEQNQHAYRGSQNAADGRSGFAESGAGSSGQEQSGGGGPDGAQSDQGVSGLTTDETTLSSEPSWEDSIGITTTAEQWLDLVA